MVITIFPRCSRCEGRIRQELQKSSDFAKALEGGREMSWNYGPLTLEMSERDSAAKKDALIAAIRDGRDRCKIHRSQAA